MIRTSSSTQCMACKMSGGRTQPLLLCSFVLPLAICLFPAIVIAQDALPLIYSPQNNSTHFVVPIVCSGGRLVIVSPSQIDDQADPEIQFGLIHKQSRSEWYHWQDVNKELKLISVIHRSNIAIYEVPEHALQTDELKVLFRKIKENALTLAAEPAMIESSVDKYQFLGTTEQATPENTRCRLCRFRKGVEQISWRSNRLHGKDAAVTTHRIPNYLHGVPLVASDDNRQFVGMILHGRYDYTNFFEHLIYPASELAYHLQTAELPND